MREGVQWVPTQGQFFFEQFCLDTIGGELRQGQEVKRLTGKAFSVLHYLLDHPNKAIPAQEIQQAVWGETYVEQSAVKHFIGEIRKVLGDTWKDPRFIRTQRGQGRQGYRFIMAVSHLPRSGALGERLDEVVLDRAQEIGHGEAKALLQRFKGEGQ